VDAVLDLPVACARCCAVVKLGPYYECFQHFTKI